MKNQNDSATTVLQKHLHSQPKIAVVISMTEGNAINLSISHPATIAEIAVMSKVFERYVNLFFDEQVKDQNP